MEIVKFVDDAYEFMYNIFNKLVSILSKIKMQVGVSIIPHYVGNVIQ